MEANIIDWTKAPSGSDLEMLSIFYSFLKISEILTGIGATPENVKELKLTYKDEDKVTEVGFREFLKSITSMIWDESQLTQDQIKAINAIQDYLAIPIEQADQPIVTGDEKTLDDYIKEAQG